jgi:tripartite motif-containing protein 71
MRKILMIFAMFVTVLIISSLSSGCTNKRIPPSMALTPLPTITPVYAKTGSFGASGTCSGVNNPMQFMTPCGIAVDSDNNIFLADLGNHRITKFDSGGNSLASWGGSACADYGSADGQFKYPHGIAIDNSDNIYVLDTANHRVQKFGHAFNFLAKWGSQGSGPGQFSFPTGIAVSGAGTVYIADTNNNRIQKFDSSGTFITQWGSYGSADGQFNEPTSLAVDSTDSIVYVTDTMNKRVQKFTSTGSYLLQWGGFISINPPATPLDYAAVWGIAVDADGFVYVADPPTDTIIKFDSDGNSLTGFEVADAPYYGVPWAIAVDHNKDVYAVCYNSHVMKFGY